MSQVDAKENNLQAQKSQSEPRRQWKLNDFEILKPSKPLAVGSHLVRETSSQFVGVLRAVSKLEIQKEGKEYQLQREAEIHSHLRHPNILRMFGYFHDENYVYFVEEYVINGLHNKLQLEKRFNETRAAEYISQLVQALKYLHSKKVVHRDIKPENVLITLCDIVKLTGFGLSIHGLPTKRDNEMIEGSLPDERVDLWSLGVLCYELLVGVPPFPERTPNESSDIYFPDYVSQDAQDLICQMLQRNPFKRLSLDGVLAHPWIQMTV